MPKNYRKEAEGDILRNESLKRWIATRVDAIHRNITAHDVLRRNGVDLKQGRSDREEQFSCPFHGSDNKPSARVYPDSTRRRSHVWCFVCHEQWDAITLWKKFSGFEGKFTHLLSQIERDFGLPTPEAPSIDIDEPDDTELDDLYILFEVCERRLKGAKKAFDMRGFLIIGSLLDKLRNGVENGTVDYPKARETLQKALDKIGEKQRSCPDD